MTRNERTRARFPLGSRVECIDDSTPYRDELEQGRVYTVTALEFDEECPLICVNGSSERFAPSRFRVVERYIAKCSSCGEVFERRTVKTKHCTARRPALDRISNAR